MSHQMEFAFAKVCYADKPDVYNLGEFALPAPQPMILAKEEPHDDHHHHRL